MRDVAFLGRGGWPTLVGVEGRGFDFSLQNIDGGHRNEVVVGPWGPHRQRTHHAP